MEHILWVVTVCVLVTMALMGAMTKMRGRSIDTLQASVLLTVGALLGGGVGAFACYVAMLVVRNWTLV
jgi:hypothetical protein